MESNHQDQHRNRMAGPWFPTKTSREQLLAEQKVPGRIISSNYFPFVAKLIDIEVDLANKQYRQIVIPASMEETHQHWNTLNLYQGDGDKQSIESRTQFAQKVAAELWQESWYRGVPATATIFCDACQQERPAHGSNLYEAARLCNACVDEVEVLMAERKLPSVDSWVNERAALNRLQLNIDESERKGRGYFPLPDGKWLDIICLYQFTRHSEYSTESEDKTSWPYPDMQPTMYQGYLRSNWHPGEYFNAPDEEIIFTDRNKLFSFLHSGGQLPSDASRNPRRKPKHNGKKLKKGEKS